MATANPRAPGALVLATLAGFACLATIAAAEEPRSPAEAFRQAVEQAEQRNYRRAIALVEQLLPGYGAHPNVAWNLGIWTDGNPGHRFLMLRAAVAVPGRAVPLYEAG